MGFKMRGTSMNGKNKFTTKRGKLNNAAFLKPRVTLNSPRINPEYQYQDEAEFEDFKKFARDAGYTRGELPFSVGDDGTQSSILPEGGTYQTRDELARRNARSKQDEQRWKETRSLLQEYKKMPAKSKIDLDYISDEEGNFISGSGEKSMKNPVYREFFNNNKDRFKVGNTIRISKLNKEFNDAFNLAANLDNELKVSASRGYGFDSGVGTDTIIFGGGGRKIKPESFGIDLENQDRYKVNPAAAQGRRQNKQLYTAAINNDKVKDAKAKFLKSVNEGNHVPSSAEITLKKLDPDYYSEFVKPYDEMGKREFIRFEKKFKKAKEKNPSLTYESYVNPNFKSDYEPVQNTKRPSEDKQDLGLVGLSSQPSAPPAKEKLSDFQKSIQPPDTSKEANMMLRNKRNKDFFKIIPDDPDEDLIEDNENLIADNEEENNNDGEYIPQTQRT